MMSMINVEPLHQGSEQDKPQREEKEPSECNESQMTRRVLGSININIVSDLMKCDENTPFPSNAISIDIGTVTSTSGCAGVSDDTGKRGLKRNAADADLENITKHGVQKEARWNTENFRVRDSIFRSFAAEEEAKMLLFGTKKINYHLSMKKLKEVQPSEAVSALSKKFAMLECAVHMESEDASELINEAVDAICALRQDDANLCDLAKLYGVRGYYLKAIVMYRCACRSAASTRRMIDSFSYLSKSMFSVKKIIAIISKRSYHGSTSLREIAVLYGMPLMKEMLCDLRDMRVHSAAERASFEGGCLKMIASAYSDLQEYQEAINACEEGLEKMKELLGENVGQHHSYVDLLEILGLAHRALNNKEEAIRSFEQYAELRIEMKNYGREEREKVIQNANMHLDELRGMEDLKPGIQDPSLEEYGRGDGVQIKDLKVPV